MEEFEQGQFGMRRKLAVKPLRTTEEIIDQLRARSLPVYAGAGSYQYVVNSEPDALCIEAADLIERLLSEQTG